MQAPERGWLFALLDGSLRDRRTNLLLRDSEQGLLRRFWTMAAILFLVAVLGLLFAGRSQAQAADGSKPVFRFQLWQLGLALFLPLICASQIPTIAKLIAVALTASAFSFSVFRARHAHDFDDLHF